MFSILPVIFFAVWFGLFFNAFSKAAKKRNAAGRPQSGDHAVDPAPSVKERYSYQTAAAQQRKPAAGGRSKISAAGSVKIPRSAKSSAKGSGLSACSVLMEDRSNDWLAKQLREESRIKKLSGLDLGASHSVACAADELKKFHIARHSDKIDTGEY